MKVVSFSGIDGAGKSTQIFALQAWLREAGLHSEILTFWDDVVVAARLREFMSRTAFRGDQGIGTPEKPLHRRDKNVDSWPVTAVRFALYFADAIHARLKIASLKNRDMDVLILDRYLYDELANLPLNRRLSRFFIGVVLKLTRQPDLALVIDADPAAARARKPEYPLEFIHRNRQAYLTLARLIPNIAVIDPLPVEKAQIQIRRRFHELLEREQKICSQPAIS